MVQVADGFGSIPSDIVSLYYTTDIQIANLPVFVFHGPSTTTNSTLNSSRIQIHIFTAGGYQSFPRLTISPNSPFYSSVNELPRDKQGDEVCRGLAFGLLKYFRELPEVVKSTLIVQSAHTRGRRPGSAPTLFGEQHAANLASTMVKVDNMTDILQNIESSLQPQSISNLDVDLVLPPGSFAALQEDDDAEFEDEDSDPTLKQYGEYAPLIRLFGLTSFLPTSRLRRAPSKPTTLNRTRSFLKAQKLSLRREMGELVDTEGRYVVKMHELVNHIADDFRVKAKARAFGSFSPSEQDLKKLFPNSLDKILQVNSAFLSAIRKVMDETEEEAMQDLEQDQASFTRSRYGGTGRLKEPSGALAFAKVLLEWFPRFADCYQDYIRASQEFPQIISSFLKQPSSFTQRVQQTGEQRLRSAVIEPVQRLPRYSLFIDNIVNYLPITHPAIQPLLKARDIITDICSLDPPSTDGSQIVSRLKNLVEAWPANLVPHGRLITAVDFTELSPPFRNPSNSRVSANFVMLLFGDSVIILRRTGDATVSARGILAEVDRPSAATMIASVTAAAGGQKQQYPFRLSGWHDLREVRFSESNDGKIAWMTSTHELKNASTVKDRNTPADTTRCFVLQGSYEGKASKWTEEVTKARIEGRFSEKERETPRWSLRNVSIRDYALNVYSAVFEEGLDTLIEGRKEPAPIRIVVDHEKGTKGSPVGHYGIEIIADITVSEPNVYRLQMKGLNESVSVDTVDSTTFMPVFAKRVSDLLRTQFNAGNPSLCPAFFNFYSSILKSFRVQTELDRSRSLRPSSPVKFLSNFLNGGGSISSSSPSKHPRTPLLGSIPAIGPPSVSRTNSFKEFDQSEINKASLRIDHEEVRATNPLVRLEETFTGYIASLKSRKGNIIGKLLRTRAAADELSINAVYNAFIESPMESRMASEASIDVLFAAFEKFLRIAWEDQMGPVISVQTLQLLQEKSAKLFPGDFADFLNEIFGDMAPQNKRAFIAIVKLLADLLEGCGNDGDRGALTAAFAELLVGENDPHNYINLLDRMVEDCDRLFDGFSPGASGAFTTSAYGSISSTIRSSHSANTGSMTSNASSLRKRLGFDTLLRQNSKNESDSRPSVWRSLSKATRNTATSETANSSATKGSLSRSRSTDTDTRLASPNRRPGSRDRPTVLGAFDDRPSSSHATTRLSTIGASPPPESDTVSRSGKKRRSSLSDLKALMAAASLNSPKSSPTVDGSSIPRGTVPRTSSPSKPLSPVRDSIADSPSHKENKASPPTTRGVGHLTERPQNVMSSEAHETKSIKGSGSGHHKVMSQSNIPTLKGSPIREKANSFTTPASSPQKTQPQKLRLQSPQKLRERLQNEAKAINEAEASLQSELSKIGEEMAKLNGGLTPRVNTTELNKLSQNIKALESRIPVLVKDLTSRNDLLKKDLETSLQASEYKVKGLDQLYKESSAENELLYEKFNGELGKIVKALKGKGKEDKEELVAKLKEAVEETARVKKENARLRREMLTMRTLLKANE